MGGLAEALATNDPQAAVDVCIEREAICRYLGRDDARVEALGLRAQTLVALGKPADALAPLREQDALSRNAEMEWQLPKSLLVRRDALRAALKVCADLEAALDLHGQLEQVCRELGDGAGVRSAVRGRTGVLRKLGRGSPVGDATDPMQLSFEL
jgi:hypothetical protein